MPSVSIIVPVYNVEPFIHHCIDSIMTQTFTDFELILVDDGSPDRCGAICEEYAAKDDRIIVVHKENGGLASARNAGLDIASGEYILFCDSDDFVAKDWCRHLLDAAVANPDLIAFGDVTVVNGHSNAAARPSGFAAGRYPVKETFLRHFPRFACTYIYRASVIRKFGLRFPRDVIIEDIPFVLEYMKRVSGIYCCGYAEYFYYKDDRETLSRKFYVDGFRKWREKYDAIQSFITEKIPESEREEVKRAASDEYLYIFLTSLDNSFDERNSAGFLQKMKYNRDVVRSWEFQDCLAFADTSREDSRYIWLLKHRMYFIGWSLVQLANMKNKRRMQV